MKGKIRIVARLDYVDPRGASTLSQAEIDLHTIHGKWIDEDGFLQLEITVNDNGEASAQVVPVSEH